MKCTKKVNQKKTKLSSLVHSFEGSFVWQVAETTEYVFFLHVSSTCSARPGLLPEKAYFPEKFVFIVCQVGLQNSTHKIRQATAHKLIALHQHILMGKRMDYRYLLTWKKSWNKLSFLSIIYPCKHPAKLEHARLIPYQELREFNLLFFGVIPLLRYSALCHSSLCLFKLPTC